MELFSWNGQVVWKGGDETQSTFPEVLSGLGVPEKQAEYIQSVLHPLMFNMSLAAVNVLASDPGFFCLEWLIRHLNAPTSVTVPVMEWKERRQGNAKPSLTSVPVAAPSILKKEGESSPKPKRGTRKATITDTLVEISTDGPSTDVPSPATAASPTEESVQTATPFVRNSRRRRTSMRIVMPPISEIERHLASLKCLEDLDDQERRAAAKVCTVKQFDAHSEIVRIGQTSSNLLVVLSGRCRVLVPEFKRALKPGDTFNETALVTGETVSEELIVAAPDGDVEIMTLSSKDLEALGLRKKCNGIKKQKRVEDCSAKRQQKVGVEQIAEDPVSLVDNEVSRFKTDEDFELIKLSVSRNHLTELLQLSQEQLDEMASRMYLREYAAESVIIRQGDRGEHFFVVKEGMAELVHDPPDASRAVQFWTGSSFGELALLYNCLRKATIVTRRATMLWVLDLSGWRHVLEKMPTSRLESYFNFLGSVPEVMKRVPSVEKRRALADCLEEVYYQNGEEVVAFGQGGGALYIILDGTCGAYKVDGWSRKLDRGSYFGELSLFVGEPQQESIIVTSDHATLLQLTREVCKHLNVCVDEESGAQTSNNTRRHSLMHLAKHEASSLSLNRLDANRVDVPHERLEDVGILGRGSFARVNLVHDPKTGGVYALKILSKGAIVKQNLKQAVISERNTLAEVSDSSFVVKLITTYKDVQFLYLLMEAVYAGDLFGLYADNDWYGDDEKSSFYCVCVALGLDYIHSKKIIHRDIKLENVLLDSSGYAKITDFGIAKVVLGKTYTLCGTSDYMAPETLKQVGYNRAVDWWALGILAFAMMAARLPFDSPEVMQVYRNIVKGFRKELFPDDFSENLIEFVKNLCRKKPQERLPMMPGGLSNLGKLPWVTGPCGGEECDNSRLQHIATFRHEAPWVMENSTLEEMRNTLDQVCDDPLLDANCDDDTCWDSCF